MNRAVNWILGLCSAFIIAFMMWVGTTLSRLDKTVATLIATTAIDIENVQNDVLENKNTIKQEVKPKNAS